MGHIGVSEIEQEPRGSGQVLDLPAINPFRDELVHPIPLVGEDGCVEASDDPGPCYV